MQDESATSVKGLKTRLAISARSQGLAPRPNRALVPARIPQLGMVRGALHALGATLAVVLLSLPAWGVADVPKRVLVLQSFGPQFAPFHAFSAQLRAQLAALWPYPIQIHETVLETALFGEPQAEAPFLEYLAALYGKQRLDLVISVGGPAARFVQRHRERLFQATPLLAAGVEERLVERRALSRLDTVVTDRLDLPGLVENILKVLPRTTHLYVVLGASPFEHFWQSELEREFGPFASRLAITYWSDLGFEQMLRHAAQLPADSAILYGILLMDADGIPHAQSQALSALHAVANAPVFGIYDSDLGLGPVGGPLIPVTLLSQRTAEVAARILGGEAPGDIHTPPTELTGPVFDWRELRRWGIPEARLSPGSEVRFREPSLWEHYRWRIIGVASLILVQASLIMALAVNLARRRQAERRLSESEDRLALAADDIGIWVWDHLTNRVMGNARWCGLFGLESAQSFSLETVLERVHAADRDQVRAAIRRSQIEHDAYLGEFRVQLPDGTQRWLSARGRPESNTPTPGGRYLGATIDITERRATEDTVRDLSRRLIQSQEQERARIARELHDDLTQRLARLAIDATGVEQVSTDRGVREVIAGLRRGLVRLSDDVHALSYQLHPAVLKDLGLVEALRVECHRCSTWSGAQVSLSVGALPDAVPSDKALCLFRVAQEALRNTQRHAGAQEVRVSLAGVSGGLQLVVQDDGVGFDPKSEIRAQTLGLASMRERVSLLGGELDLESQPGLGTLVLAWVPLGESRP